MSQTDGKKNPEPLFLAELELLEPDIIFRPSLNKAIFNNFFTVFTGLVEDIFHIAELVPRVHKVPKLVCLAFHDQPLSRRKACLPTTWRRLRPTRS